MMKKTILAISFWLLAISCCQAQTKQRVMIPGKGNIDVEKLNKRVDLSQDISRLNITE